MLKFSVRKLPETYDIQIRKGDGFESLKFFFFLLLRFGRFSLPEIPGADGGRCMDPCTGLSNVAMTYRVMNLV
jgi:hypothetical protein